MNHSSRPLVRSATTGLVLGVVVVFGVLGAPRDARRTPVRPAQAPATAELPAVPCRLVNSPLVVESSPDEVRAWSTLQNVGSVPATPASVQIGWTGAATLAGVVLETEGAPAVDLFAGAADSPASVRLRTVGGTGGTPSIAPGGTARLGLRFRVDTTGDSVAVGASVLFLSEGCALALHQPRGSTCGLEATNVRASTNDPRRVIFSLVNSGATAQKIRVIDVTWPVERNGRLTALYLDGALRHTFADPLASSPAAIQLGQVLDDPIVLEPGRSLAVWLQFERIVADEPYVVTAVTADGCVASSTTWLDAPGCGVVTNAFTTRGSRMQLRLTNSLPVEQTVHSLDLFWPVGTNGPLVSARLDGTEVWSGRADRAPASILVGDGARIGPHETATLELAFEAPVSAGGTSAIAGTDYTLVVTFRGSCQLVFSTQRRAAAGCSVTAGELVPRTGQPEVEVKLTSTGAKAALRRLAVSWPERNGALTGARLGEATLFAGDQPPGPEPFTLDFGAGSEPTLAPNTTAALRLSFATRASRLGYALSLSFVDADGEPCAALVVTPPQGEMDCRMAITQVSREGGRDVEVYVANTGADEVELRFVNVAWPTNDGRNRLLSAYLVDSDTEHLLWSGDVRRSPARIPLSQTRTAVVDPGETARLRLHFDPLDMVGDPATTFQVTVGAGDACQASWPDASGAVRADRRSVSGTILDLPAGSVWGRWTVGRQQGTTREVLAIEVTDATRLEPPAARPQVGDLVTIDVVVYDSVWHAEKVVFLSPEEMVSLVARVVEIDPSVPDGRRPGWIRVNALSTPVRVAADTHIDGQLAVGTRVQIEGTMDGQGQITATRITVQAPPAGEVVDVRGTVQDARQSDANPLQQVWIVDRYHVEVDLSKAENRWPAPPYDRVPARGDRLEIRGRLTGNVLVATKVTHVETASTARLTGIVTALPDGGVLGTWTISLESGGQASFLVETASVVDTRSAPATVGVKVDVVAQESDAGRLSALSVRTDWPD